jgi:hypothetical protein
MAELADGDLRLHPPHLLGVEVVMQIQQVQQVLFPAAADVAIKKFRKWSGGTEVG